MDVTTDICGQCDGTGAEPVFREVKHGWCGGRGCESCSGTGVDIETVYRRLHLTPPEELLAAVLDLDEWIDFSQPLDDPPIVPDEVAKEAWARLGRAVEAYRSARKAAAGQESSRG